MGILKDLQEKEQEREKFIRFTDDFWQMLDRIKGFDKLIWDISALDSNPNVKNPMGVEVVDMSDKPWHFDLVVRGKNTRIKVAQFIRTFFGDEFEKQEIYDFTIEYNKIVEGISGKTSLGDTITPREFKYEPLNVRDTFISLVTETYPMGHEDELLPFLPPNLNRDKFGNYYLIIGNSDTAFTSHLDTASRTKSEVNLVGYKKDGQEFIITDNTSILGADDKSGVTILMYMIAKRIPGVYWFFYGEERGGQGSAKVANNFHTYKFMKNIKKIVSFDRRNYHSVITQQMGLQCCSNEFADQLCQELNKSGMKMSLDPTGVFTDSANFIDLIPECTNVSVGYFNEHTHDEMQNITFLEKLCKAVVNVNWRGLKAYRKVGVDGDIMVKYSRLMKVLKRKTFYNQDSIKGSDGKLLIELEITDSSIDKFHSDLKDLQEIFRQHRLDPYIRFNEQFIKIELQ
jgi:hypothetical protein